jgi:hypothetical protein
MKLLPGVSLEDPTPFVEQEFLHRELGIKWQFLNEPEFEFTVRENFKKGKKSLVIVSNAIKYLTIFRSLPEGSIVLLLLSDEGYNSKSRKLSIKSHSVSEVIRNYSIAPARPSDAIKELYRLLSHVEMVSHKHTAIMIAFFRGCISAYRMFLWRLASKKIEILPLGYTKKFAYTYSSYFGLSSNQSLFEFAIDTMPRNHLKGITFRGKIGQIQRQIDIDTAARKGNFDLKLIDGAWAGADDNAKNAYDYLQSLLTYKYTLCPPGFINNESFRYYEALLCGSKPIEDKVAITHMGTCPSRPTFPDASARVRLNSVKARIDELRSNITCTLE